jgi:hypothetical protein
MPPDMKPARDRAPRHSVRRLVRHFCPLVSRRTVVERMHDTTTLKRGRNDVCA